MSICWLCAAWCFFMFFSGTVPCEDCLYFFSPSCLLSSCPSLYILFDYWIIHHAMSSFERVCDLRILSFSIFKRTEQWVHFEFLVLRSSILFMFLPILDLLSRSSSNMTMHHCFYTRSTASHLWLEWDPRSRHPGSSQGKQSRSHKTFSSQRRELPAEDRQRGHGSQRCCLSTLKLWWIQCDTMTWCNCMQWPGLFSFHFVALCFDLKVKLLWFPWFFWILMTVCLQTALIRMAGMCFLQTPAGPWKLISEWWSWAKLFF